MQISSWRPSGAAALAAIVAAMACCLPAGALAGEDAWRHHELRRIPAAEAHQGVAVDGEHFYAIDNKSGRQRPPTPRCRTDHGAGETKRTLAPLTGILFSSTRARFASSSG
ncbi:hypothetical protein BH23VER1_BH23VER1_25440 [soil metagenome]